MVPEAGLQMYQTNNFCTLFPLGKTPTFIKWQLDKCRGRSSVEKGQGHKKIKMAH